MKIPRIVVAAPKSGSGKTLVTIALLEAMKRKQKKVRAFKCGPDYIDPMFHKKILGIPSKNLDLFFMDDDAAKKTFASGNDSDISVIEGVMGLYDGLGGNTQNASTYEIAKSLQSPVLLVIDAKGMGFSAVAEINGFLSLDSSHLVKGVILNNATKMQFENLKPEIEKNCNVRALGFFPRIKDLNLESRHLGLKLPDEIQDIHSMIEIAGNELEKSVDLEGVLSIAGSAPEIHFAAEEKKSAGKKAVIAVALDDAFCFYYEDNLRLLENLGAELVYFSPLADEEIPHDADGFILGGGYPELHAEKLSRNTRTISSIRRAVEDGLPSLAECGGFMYLHKFLETKEKSLFEMCGVIDAKCSFKEKLVRFGYAEFCDEKKFCGKRISVRGHEFHYFDSDMNGEDCTAEKPVSQKRWKCCHVSENHWWGFPHLCYISNPEFAENFVGKCAAFRSKK